MSNEIIGKRFQHVKRGTIYQVIALARYKPAIYHNRIPEDNDRLIVQLDSSKFASSEDRLRVTELEMVVSFLHSASVPLQHSLMTPTFQKSGIDPLPDNSLLVIYLGQDGRLWARTFSEFTDGRFVEETDEGFLMYGGIVE